MGDVIGFMLNVNSGLEGCAGDGLRRMPELVFLGDSFELLDVFFVADDVTLSPPTLPGVPGFTGDACAATFPVLI